MKKEEFSLGLLIAAAICCLTLTLAIMGLLGIVSVVFSRGNIFIIIGIIILLFAGYFYGRKN